MSPLRYSVGTDPELKATGSLAKLDIEWGQTLWLDPRFAGGLSLCIRFFVAEFLRCNLLQAQTLAASFIQKDRPNNPNI